MIPSNMTEKEVNTALEVAEQYNNIDTNKLLNMLSAWAKSSSYNFWSGYWVYHKSHNFCAELEREILTN